ncbi:MAG: DUF5103 domain-containing protein [Muribaculaceae bacterium]|nr:DUF5103 domain-containing protein [Muribaculaceae bacterium]
MKRYQLSTLWLRTVVMLCLFAVSCSAAAATDTATRVFDPAFRTLRIESSLGFTQAPVIRLNSGDRVIVSFDEIGDDFSQLQYSLLHCNADWQPSRLLESEYLDGFNVADVDDYAFSTNTFIHYVNYRIELPNEYMQPLVSGNYLLRVYERDEPENILLQARFAVSEARTGIAGEASGRTDRGHNTEWQQLEFLVNTSDINISNPFQDLLVTVTQNNTPATTRTITHPMRVEGSNVIFSHSPELIFDAGNEFRRFETIRTTYPGMHVDSMRYGGSNYHAYLMHDTPRVWKDYKYDETQRGRFKIREYNSTDSDLGADYVTVHFTLETPEIPGARVYVDGDMTHHLTDESYLMKYDYTIGAYTLQLPLKQGSYNYRYIIIPPGEKQATPTPIEGNHFETLNEYLIQVYYRPPGARADRLIGHAQMLANP